MDEVAALAERHRPKLLIAGGSAYPRTIDFAAFRSIADAVGAHLLVDMAHFAGLVAAGLPEERAAFFLDPWNLPYWISRVRSDKPRAHLVMLYSFGPNRRRDSTRWRILGDDVAVIVWEKGKNPEQP